LFFKLFAYINKTLSILIHQFSGERDLEELKIMGFCFVHQHTSSRLSVFHVGHVGINVGIEGIESGCPIGYLGQGLDIRKNGIHVFLHAYGID